MALSCVHMDMLSAAITTSIEMAKIIVEIKSPYPSEQNPELVYYEVPPHHVPQILYEIKAYDATEA